MTFFDPVRSVWRQVYVTDTGNTLDLTGNFVGHDLVLNGDNATFDGRLGLHRMTWSSAKGGGVRQLWAFSANGGKNWQLLFDGHYRRQR